jgi:hypothetical protein
MKQQGTYIDEDLLTLSYKLQSNCTSELLPAIFSPVIGRLSKYWSREWLALLDEDRLYQMPQLRIHGPYVYFNVIIDDKPPIVIIFCDETEYEPVMAIHGGAHEIVIWHEAHDHERYALYICDIWTYEDTLEAPDLSFVEISYRIEYDEIATKIGYEKTLNNSVNISYEVYKKLVMTNCHIGYMTN